MAVAKPTPSERMSCGKLSAGKMPTRLLTAEMVVLEEEQKAAALMNCRKANRPWFPALPPAAKNFPAKKCDVPAGASELIPAARPQLTTHQASGWQSALFQTNSLGDKSQPGINHKPWDYEADKEDAVKRRSPPVTRREQGFDVFMGRRYHFIAQ